MYLVDVGLNATLQALALIALRKSESPCDLVQHVATP